MNDFKDRLRGLGPLDRYKLMLLDATAPAFDIRNFRESQKRMTEHYEQYGLVGWLKGLSAALMAAMILLTVLLWRFGP